MTKGPPRHNETWWWNRDVEEVVAKRKVCHKAWRKSKLAEDKHIRYGQEGGVVYCNYDHKYSCLDIINNAY